MTDSDRAALGAQLKEMREYRGYSQGQVAEYLGIPRSAISLIESGARRLDALEMRKLARLYKCSLEELAGERAADAEPGSVDMVARAAADLSPEDCSEVLRFAQYLRSRSSEQAE